MKCIVSLSGGRDSSTCLGLAVERYGAENVYAIGFEYGSTHPQELECAKIIAAYYKVPFQIIKINSEIFTGSTCTMLQGAEKEIQKDKTYKQILSEKEGKVDTYVPFRNGLFSAYIAAKAESLVQQFDEDVVIMLGQHADDSGYYIDEDGNEMLDESKAAYPDCTVSFVKAFEEVVKISSVGRVHYEAPFVKMHKWELIKTGLQLKRPVPYKYCLSCYDPIINKDGSVAECGRCATSLPGDTLILMEGNTQKYLKDISIGDKVKTFDEETHKFCISEVTNTYKHGVKPVYGIYDRNTSKLLVKATNDHKFNARKNWSDSNRTHFKYEELKNLINNKVELLSCPNISLNINIQEYALGYLRGLIEADGHIDRSVLISQKENIECVKEFGSLYNKYISPTKTNIKYDESKNTYIWSGGYGKKFLEKTKEIISKSYYEGYLNGFFIGDGYLSIYENPSNIHFGICQATFQLNKIDMVRKCLNYLDINYNEYVGINKGKASFKSDGCEMIQFISTKAQDVFNRPWLFGGEKKQRVLDILSQYSRDSRILDPILVDVSKEPIEEVEVFDITTTSGTFIANNILVHNCLDVKESMKKALEEINKENK